MARQKPAGTPPRPPTAAERRRWHQEWIERVVLPAIGGLSPQQRELARKILSRKRDLKLVAHPSRKWDADRRLELLTDYELLLKQGFKSAEAHRLLQDLHATSMIPTRLREARKLFPKKTKRAK